MKSNLQLSTLRGRRRTTNRVLPARRQSLALWIAGFFFLSILAATHQHFYFATSLDYGIPIPDIVNLSNSFDNLIATGDFKSEENQFIGVTLLYGWTWLIHPSLCFVVNASLMAWAVLIFHGIGIKRLGLPAWSIVGLLGNPYLMLAMVGPNKEIPLTLLTLLFFYVFMQRKAGWHLAAFLIAGTAYLFRDGYGAFLAGSTLMFFILRAHARAFVITACLSCICIATFFGVLQDLIPVLNRNVQSFENIAADNLAVGALAAALDLDPLTAIGGLLSFALRLVYNLLSPAMFPVFQTSGGTYWIGIAYWINGLLALACIPACIAALRKDAGIEPIIALAAAISLVTLFVISVSLFVQPRYLMPILPLATVVLGYSAFDRRPPPGDPDAFSAPSYVLAP
jgi:hypothetical protein